MAIPAHFGNVRHTHGHARLVRVCHLNRVDGLHAYGMGAYLYKGSQYIERKKLCDPAAGQRGYQSAVNVRHVLYL